MKEFLKEQYQFSDYQIAVLKYMAKTLASEISKLLIMGFIFRDKLGIYVVTVAVMIFLRTATGGLFFGILLLCVSGYYGNANDSGQQSFPTNFTFYLYAL